MSVDPSALIISATKSKGKPAKMLAEMGIRIVPIVEDESPFTGARWRPPPRAPLEAAPTHEAPSRHACRLLKEDAE